MSSEKALDIVVSSSESGVPKSRSRRLHPALRAGLSFPVERFRSLLESENYNEASGFHGPVCLSAVLQYVVTQVLESAGNHAKIENENTIMTRHIWRAVMRDKELRKLLGKVLKLAIEERRLEEASKMTDKVLESEIDEMRPEEASMMSDNVTI